jgi:hypothetical protein
MILESWYWKRPLLEAADRLETWIRGPEITEEQLAQVERDIFIGFYSVRKLFEAVAKITDRTKQLVLHVEWHPNLRPVSWRNNHKIDENYDLTISNKETRDVLFVCGRIIHSFVFVPCETEDGKLEGIFFSSDNDKNSRLYFLSIDQVISLFRQVGGDDPSKIVWHRDPETGKETTIVG